MPPIRFVLASAVLANQVASAMDNAKPCATTLECGNKYPALIIGQVPSNPLIPDIDPISIGNDGKGYSSEFPLWDATAARAITNPGEVTNTHFWQTCNCYAVWTHLPSGWKKKTPKPGDNVAPPAPAAGQSCDKPSV